ncbi:MAG TPA: hypothetical protein VFA18_25320 [Gemmataceae bacterium]|nr:hypothetical protein [Gemmataceae bacterium]
MQDTRAYGYSIYLMIAVPYLLLGGFGYFMYRGLRTTQRANASLTDEHHENDPGVSSDVTAEERSGT